MFVCQSFDVTPCCSGPVSMPGVYSGRPGLPAIGPVTAQEGGEVADIEAAVVVEVGAPVAGLEGGEELGNVGGGQPPVAAKVGEGDKAVSFKFDGKFTGKDTFEGALVSETMGSMKVKGTR